MSAENIQREPTYRNVPWDKFKKPYGFTSETEPFPYGVQELRRADQSRIHKAPELDKESLVGYGPIVISVLEDDATVLLSLLSTLDYFFRSEEHKDFLPGSSVYTAWATCPEDLEKVHKSLIQDLNKQGYSNENINLLNIFDNSTNYRNQQDATEVGQKIKGQKSGGRKALEYIHQYLLSTDSNATLIQTFNTDNDTRQKYQDSLDELGIETEIDSRYKIHSVEADDSTLSLPLSWHKKDDRHIENFLNGLWNEKKIPFFGKLISPDIIKDSNDINKSLLRVIEAFRTFVIDKTPSTKYNQVIPTEKADSAAA